MAAAAAESLDSASPWELLSSASLVKVYRLVCPKALPQARYIGFGLAPMGRLGALK